MDRSASVELFYPDSATAGSTSRLYSRIIEWIGSSSAHVYVLGDGFSCRDEAGTALAGRYIAAYHKALERGARIVRVEDLSSGSPRWHSLLQKTLERFPGSFELHFIKDKQAMIAGRCFAIDADSDDCRAMVGHCEGFLAPAGLTMLSSGDTKLAGFIRGSIRALADGRDSLLVAAAGDLDKILNSLDKQ